MGFTFRIESILRLNQRFNAKWNGPSQRERLSPLPVGGDNLENSNQLLNPGSVYRNIVMRYWKRLGITPFVKLTRLLTVSRHINLVGLKNICRLSSWLPS